MARPTEPPSPPLRALKRALDADDPLAFERALAALPRPAPRALAPLATRAAARGGRWDVRAALAWTLLIEDGVDEAATEALAELGRRGVPPMLGGFALGSVIGLGGMGEVRRGLHLRSAQPVAIKLLGPEALASPKALRALRVEVRAAAGLLHEHLVALIDQGVVGPAAAALSGGQLAAGSPYLVMELVEGGTLRPWCGRLTWRRCRALLLDLLDVLAHAHARGLVHRDLKPDNVLLAEGPDGARLTDFGLASAVGGRSGARVAGTPAYMAPEQLRGAWRELGPWTDLYALGCLATALLAGAPPFGEGEVKEVALAQLTQPPPPLKPLAPVPSGFEAWRLRLLEKHPAARFQRAADAALALRALGDDAPDAPSAAPTRALTAARTVSLEVAPFVGAAPPGRAPPDDALPPLPPTWRRPAVRRLPAGLAGPGLVALRCGEPPMRGREEARDLLWSSLSSPRARVIVASGPPGVGRTRLGTWLLHEAHASGVGFTTHLDAGEEGARTPRAQFRWQGLKGAALMAAVRQELAAVALEDEGRAAALAELIQPGVSGLDLGGAEGRMRAGLAALAAFVRGRRLVLFIDDAQAEPELIDLIAGLEGAPLPLTALVAVATREARGPAEEALARAVARPGVQHLALAPLPVETLATTLCEDIGLDVDLALRLARETGGLPGQALPRVAVWARGGMLQEGPHGLVLRSGTLPEAPPEPWRVPLAGALQDEDDEASLLLASMLGASPEPGAWRRACALAGLPPPEALADRLVDEGLATLQPDGRVTLESRGWAEGLAGALERRGRLGALHAACAEVLPEGHAARPRHLLAAGRAEAAVHAAMQLAARRRAASDPRRALQALDLAEQAMAVAALPDTDPRRATLRVQRAAARVALGHHSEALRLLDAEAGGPEALRLRGLALAGAGRLAEAERTLLDALGAASDAADADEEGLTLMDLAELRGRMGRLREARLGMASARRALQGGGLVTEPWVAALSGATLALLAGDLAGADRHLWEARAGEVRIASPALKARLRLAEAQRARLAGAREDCAAHLREARRLAAAAGGAVAELADLESARLLLDLGRAQEARAVLLDLDARARAAGHEALRAEVLAARIQAGETELIEVLEPLLAETGLVHPFVASALARAAAAGGPRAERLAALAERLEARCAR